MGYQVTFAPTEEAMKKYKPWNENKPRESFLENYRLQLISYCMKPGEDSVFQIIKQINFMLRCIVSTVEDDEKYSAYDRWKENENHELWYCGWEFAHDSYVDKDETLQSYTERLFVLTSIVDTPSYFDNLDNFNTKYHDVVEDVDGFIDVMREVAIHDIINDLDEFKERDEEELESEDKKDNNGTGTF